MEGRSIDVSDVHVRALRDGLSGPLLSPRDADYDAARVVFNGVYDRRPALIARCRDAADATRALRFARRHALLFAVRGGGHSVAGHSTCADGLVIDLSAMNAARVDRATGTVHVQGGATWADVDRATQAVGLATPGGVVSSTGVAGLTLNGGVGWLRNRFGLSCDNLVAAELIGADGGPMSASATARPDLWWALRGGGGNFGIVTSFELALHAVGPDVAAAFPMYPLARATDILRRWREWVASTPPEVTSEVVIWTAPTAEQLPPTVHGQALVIPGAVYAGPVDAGARALRPTRRLGEPPLGEIAGVLPFTGVQGAFDPFFPKTGEIRCYWKSLYLDELSDAAIDLIARLGEERDSPDTMLVVEHLGEAVRAVPVEDNAFATRAPRFLVNIMANWRDAHDDAARVAWARGAWERLYPHSTRSVYLNFLGAGEHAQESLVRSAFGPNYDRLVQIKREYDPDNVFRLNQNIPPNA